MKKIMILMLLMLIFSQCESKKANKQAENTNVNSKKTVTSDAVNAPPEASSKPVMTQLKLTSVIADELKVKKSKIKVTFIELGSVRCIPCKMMMPIMKEIEEKYSDEVRVVFYDVWTDAGRPYAEKYQVGAIPTQVFLDENGKEFFRYVGFFPREELYQVLKKKGVNIK